MGSNFSNSSSDSVNSTSNSNSVNSTSNPVNSTSNSVFVVYSIDFHIVLGCYSTLEKAIEVSQQKFKRTNSWCISENILDDPLGDNMNIVYQYRCKIKN